MEMKVGAEVNNSEVGPRELPGPVCQGHISNPDQMSVCAHPDTPHPHPSPSSFMIYFCAIPESVERKFFFFYTISSIPHN